MKKIYGVHLWVQFEQNNWKSSYIMLYLNDDSRWSKLLFYLIEIRRGILSLFQCSWRIYLDTSFYFHAPNLMRNLFWVWALSKYLNQAENDFINKWMCNSVHVTAQSSNHLNTHTSHTHTHSPEHPHHTQLHTQTHPHIHTRIYINVCTVI